ncbi:MAG TPA: hypothetical protein VLG50_04940 [Candidatus Saccharimonadales bacterium]|nr:hypothetical protein [Candidatus Saccharimonadales bacterium]
MNNIQPTLLHTMQKIIQLPIEHGVAWSVFAYAVNKDIINEHGQVDDLRAIIFPLGSFNTQQLAQQHVKKVMEETGHSYFIVSRYGLAVPITVKHDQDVIIDVPVDLQGKVIEMENEEFKHQKELFDKRQKLEKELMDECENELNVDHPEHFKRHAFVALKHYTDYLKHKQECEKSFELFTTRQQALQAHFTSHPEHERDFLDFYKNKLMARGEEQLYLSIEQAYKQYRDVLLYK